MRSIKNIGVLTSGGDAPGMNAAVRAIVRTALYHGLGVKAIYQGYEGLLNEEIEVMNEKSVSGIISRGGTSLYSARCPEFKKIENVRKAVEICKKHEIDGLVVVGGDGSFRGARDLSLEGLPCIGVPATIDNDIASTDFSIGFDTAVNTVVENVDRLRDTAQSHARCSVVEVMGRNCGDIALHSAVCCGAVSVLIPEIEFSVEKDVITQMQKTSESGKNHFIIIMAEGVAGTRFSQDESLSAGMLAKYIEYRTSVETRASILGHLQRGGNPSSRDRVLAAEYGSYAVRLLMNGKGNRVVALRNNKIVDLDILKALDMVKTVNWELFRVAREISV